MSGSNYLSSSARRTVLAGLAAILGTGSSAVTARATDPARRGVDSGPTSTDVDADNLVASNSRFTVTVEDVPGSNVQTATVTIGEIAFAVVEVLERDPAVLAVDASNLIESKSIRNQDTVEVTIRIDAGGNEFVGTDETQVIVD